MCDICYIVVTYIYISVYIHIIFKQELQACMDKCEVVDYHQTMDVRGVKFTASPAGHVLGAAMFAIEIGGIKVLYTGDYSMEEDRHLSAAEMPACGPPDVLIVESTFGVQELPSKLVNINCPVVLLSCCCGGYFLPHAHLLFFSFH